MAENVAEAKKYRLRAQAAEAERDQLREQLERFAPLGKLTDENLGALIDFGKAVATMGDSSVGYPAQVAAAQEAATVALSFARGIAGENFEPWIRHELGIEDDMAGDTAIEDEAAAQVAEEQGDTEMDEAKLQEMIDKRVNELVEERITGLTARQRIERTLTELGYNPDEGDPKTVMLLSLAQQVPDAADAPAALRAAHEQYGKVISAVDGGGQGGDDPAPGQEANAGSVEDHASDEAPTPGGSAPEGQTPGGQRRPSTWDEAKAATREALLSDSDFLPDHAA